MSDYTTHVTHLRVHDEGDGWALDGASGGGKYTERVWKFDTVTEAREAVPEFVEALAEDGIRVPVVDGSVSVIVHRLDSVRVPVRKGFEWILTPILDEEDHTPVIEVRHISGMTATNVVSYAAAAEWIAEQES